METRKTVTIDVERHIGKYEHMTFISDLDISVEKNHVVMTSKKFTCKGCNIAANGKVAKKDDICKPCEREVNQHIKRICEGRE